MGRVSRYRKIKACDPFSKEARRPKVDTEHDDPVTDPAADEKLSKNFQRHMRSVERFLEAQRPRKPGAPSRPKRPKPPPNPLMRRKGESLTDFNERLRLETFDAVLESRHKRDGPSQTKQKKKEFLRRKKDKRKKRKRGDSESEEERVETAPQDVVQFGEVAERPPKLSFAPKHGQRAGSVTAGAAFARAMRLRGTGQQDGDGEGDAPTTTKSQMEQVRERVQQAYQSMKKRRRLAERAEALGGLH